MKSLKLDLENCYGIKSFKTEISFQEKNANIIYAPNGSMKTSLAQTFKDLSEGKGSRDRIHKERITKRIVTDEKGTDLPKDQVFVIEPFAPTYESKKVSTLLVNKDLKAEYETILIGVDEKKEALIKDLKKYSGLKSEIEENVSEIFTKEKGKFLVALGRIEKEVMEEPKSELSKIKYSEIFNDKVIGFLNTKDFKDKLENYTKVYDKLISSSTFFRKGVFNHFQASEIAKNLKAHGFFKADHSVYVNSSSNRQEIKTEEELTKVIETEKNSILTNSELKSSFDEIDSKLTNQDLRAFREYLLNNQIILPELGNLELLKEKIWKAYFVELRESFASLMAEFEKGKNRIQQILESASEQATRWQDVINIFNRRFSVPFKVSIENKQDVILKSVTPNIKFEFTDEEGKPVSIERTDLFKVLSNGEARALYLLNIIFEVEARREAKTETLFIIDDIADSFDYKNKYAIVEYLHDILSESQFRQIILTHNYDFYRTVSQRLELGGAKFHASREAASISLEADKIYKDPFKKWQDNADNHERNEMMVAMIPFARNLAEYCGIDDIEKKLTSLLHIKDDTQQITVGDLQALFSKVLHYTPNARTDKDRKVVEVIYEVADALYGEGTLNIELEKKISLSIAIRLKTEDILIRKINDQKFLESIKKNQTAKLIRKFKEQFAGVAAEQETILVVDRVNLMTPENIHLNSFMYEPILDMSSVHLRKLYGEVKALK